MPFTLAHPALVLPFFKSKRFSVTALIAGSMAPDFEFFLQLREVENIGHSPLGILLFDVPLTLLFCVIFHGMIKEPMINNMPGIFRKRFFNFRCTNWFSFARLNKLNILYSSFLGVITHLLWDGFTHADGFAVLYWSSLASSIQIADIRIPVYYLLQIVFSCSGLIIMILFIYKLPNYTNAVQHNVKRNNYLSVLIAVTIAILVIRLIGWPHYNSFWGVVMAVMGAVSYATILTSFLFNKPSFLKIKI